MSSLTYTFKSWNDLAELLEVDAQLRRRMAAALPDKSPKKAGNIEAAAAYERAAHLIRHTKIEEAKQ